MVHSYASTALQLILFLSASANGSLQRLSTPSSIQAMMTEVAISLQAARASGLSAALVEIPLPVTGGTELDDWPGGIRQKLATISPMLEETMRTLGFSSDDIKNREFLGECGEEDAVGLWRDETAGFQIVCFPTVETLPAIDRLISSNTMQRSADVPGPLLALVNQNFFSDAGAKAWLTRLDSAYHLESLNVKGVGGMSVRGLLFRQFPGEWAVARRLDEGGYEVLQREATRPDRRRIDAVFLEDSKMRDKDLSFVDRLKKQIPRFGD